MRVHFFGNLFSAKKTEFDIWEMFLTVFVKYYEIWWVDGAINPRTATSFSAGRFCEHHSLPLLNTGMFIASILTVGESRANL